jgi:two-component system, cell cycle sensor histidine kinase and response regulator CckA
MPIGEGSGLGLAAVYGIITEAGGYVQIRSEVGFGTTVSCLLPVVEGMPTNLDGTSDRRNIGPHDTILVVDDEDALRESTSRVLARNGYQVLTASSGAEALALARDDDRHIDLLLTDVVMPHILGKELAAEMLALRPGLRVLYMSGYAQPILATRGTIDDGVELIEKPFSQEALLSKVRDLLNAKT